MKRRLFLTLLPTASVLGAAAAAQETLIRSGWEAWKTAFLDQEGRVVDTHQGNVSHSEGQGWAMLLAAHAEDAASFEQMFGWTESNLAVRQDPLLAWRWRPEVRVTDYNNSTDGDIFYAWALLIAARQFGVRAYAERSREIAHAIDGIVVRNSPRGGLLLRPAAEQFYRDGTEILNPSHTMPLALHALSAAFDLPRLGQVADDGEALIARVAERGLVPDWIALDAHDWRPAETMGPLYGSIAMRVALYLVWSGRLAHPAVVRARSLFENANQAPAIRANPASLAVIDRSDEPGYGALSDLILRTAATTAPSPIREFTADQPYYPATLHLLTLLAEQAV